MLNGAGVHTFILMWMDAAMRYGFYCYDMQHTVETFDRCQLWELHFVPNKMAEISIEHENNSLVNQLFLRFALQIFGDDVVEYERELENLDEVEFSNSDKTPTGIMHFEMYWKDLKGKPDLLFIEGALLDIFGTTSRFHVTAEENIDVMSQHPDWTLKIHTYWEIPLDCIYRLPIGMGKVRGKPNEWKTNSRMFFIRCGELTDALIEHVLKDQLQHA